MNSLTPTDVYAIVNSVARQATGQDNLVATDTSSFVAVGETLLRTAAENTLSAISTVLSTTIFSDRPYAAKLRTLYGSDQRWGAMVRKIIPLYEGAEASEDWNTDLAPNQLADGASVDMFKIKKPKVVQLNFYGTKLLQKHITRFRDQLSLAFQSEAEFAAFLSSVMKEFTNDLETLHEAETRATLLNFIAGIHAMSLTEVDLVAGYNTEYGTTYTRAQLLSTYVESFMKYVASEIKNYSELLTDRTSKYHANLSAYSPILHFTPKDRQRMIMYNPIFLKAEATVYSSLFNPKYLEIGDFEGVNYWQALDKPTEINIKPNILNVVNGQSVTASEAVNLPYVLGLLYDADALGVNYQFDYAATTPFNPAGGYYNMYIHERKNFWNDFTENAVLFVLGAGGVTESAGGESAGGESAGEGGNG